MSHPKRWTLLPAVLLIALSGCAVTAPATSPSPVTTPDTVSATPSSEMSSPAASPTQSASETAASTTVELAGDGILGLKFGTPEGTIAELLTARLGKPDERMEGVLCELNDAAPWAATVTYGGLWVQYQAKTASKKAPRTLTAWGFQLVEPFKAPLVMAGGVPLNLDFTELKKQYPDGKLSDSELGDGNKIFTLANGLTFIGVEKPDTVMAGEISYCD